MWIERIVAHAFGPLRDETLELGEGMTLVVGPNEAGKTSWHAATRLALSGVRRGPGRTKETAGVIERHRPWDAPDRWEVEARLHLADGRTIDITQDLAGRVACRARDVVLGEDVSSEIINDGTPDATRWLGLDRDSFASVVAVSQAQIMAVADSAAALQDHLQRAAATRGTDATAAEAIERLKAFRKDQVGAVRVGATGPLWSAMREQEAADAALAEARRLHGEYLDREARLEEAEASHLAGKRAQAGVEAARARREAEDLTRRAARTAELTARHPGAPAALAARDELADEVAGALDGWRRRPAPVTLDGPSRVELEAQIAGVPAVPEGDRRPDPAVVQAARALDLAEEAARLHRERPASRATTASAGDGEPGAAAWALPILVGVAAAVAGIVAVTLGQALPGAALILVGAALVAWGWSRGSARRLAAAGASAAAALDEQLAAEWEAQAQRLEEALDAAGERMRVVLRERGAAADGELRAALGEYERACADRDAQAQAAAGAEGLRRALEARRALEESDAQAAVAAAATEAALRTAASRIGEQGDGPTDEVVARLTTWQGRRAEMARASEVAIREWQELQGLLAGRSVDELGNEASRRSHAAERLVAAFGGEPPPLPHGADPEAAEGVARAATAVAKATVDAFTGELRLMAATLPDVAEAEERAVAARAEQARVRDLAEVLDQTLELLQAAERRVHRDIAPVLAASVQRHLAAITGGAYVEVGMNPRDLSVEVKEARTGQWRDARLLSEGTREQVYLLLRVAMAEHLVTTAETAPLLLDEVTAQSDPERKRQVLDVLHALSADRQVILFTHDAEVLAWADRCLAGPRDRLVRLGGW